MRTTSAAARSTRLMAKLAIASTRAVALATANEPALKTSAAARSMRLIAKLTTAPTRAVALATTTVPALNGVCHEAQRDRGKEEEENISARST